MRRVLGRQGRDPPTLSELTGNQELSSYASSDAIVGVASGRTLHRDCFSNEETSDSSKSTS